MENTTSKVYMTPAKEPASLRDRVALDAVKLTNLLKANYLVQAHGLASTIEYRLKEDIGTSNTIPENHPYFRPYSKLTAIQSLIMSGRNEEAHKVSVEFADAVLKLVEKV